MNNIITLDHVNTRFDGKEGWLSALPQDVNKTLWKKSVLVSFEKCRNAKAGDFIECVLKAVRDGLSPDGREAVIYQFGNKPTYIPMIAGVVKRIYSGKFVKRITTHIVHEKDEFDMWTDISGDNITFRPLLRGERGQPIGAFAMAFLANGETIMRYMAKQEIDKRRQESKAGNKSDAPWVKWWDEMAKKTAIHNMFKMIPLESAAHDMLLDSIDAPEKEGDMVDVTHYSEPEQSDAIEYDETPFPPPPIKQADITTSLMNQSDDPFGRE